ncbi:hypothetical protein [Arcobacter cloacae]|uniref:Uncharacterized protein n=1 Tax=Arcobacter cloacae TaxID=1054034 RepID=A0A6M8NPL4_9BACT|nr:hypothetical protein [Arcobacter cloacae]QKF90397.1 hypothetical protein ACLO_1915 [Arcobacter cloacae]RXI39602.1 hypothetical protein CP963_09705 [Arcobacter cloacae]
MKKPYLSSYEMSFKNNISIDGRTFTDSVEVTDCDISLNFDVGGKKYTNTLEDADLDNLFQIDKVYNNEQ